MIHVVTDSTADFNPGEAQELGVHVVPLTVVFGDEQLRDGVDISADRFYERLIEGSVQPKTSQPSPEAFAETYRELLKAPGDQVISVHLSGKLSGTVQSAMLAAQEFDGRVTVIDTLSISGGLQGFLRDAVARASAGGSMDEIVAALEERRSRHHLWLTVDTLTYLHRGGRIGGASAFLGGVLGVKPVLELRDGLVEPHARARSFGKAVAMMRELADALPSPEAIYVMYSTNRDVADRVAGEFREQKAGVDVRVGQIGPVVGTYVGPGTLGVAAFEGK